MLPVADPWHHVRMDQDHLGRDGTVGELASAPGNGPSEQRRISWALARKPLAPHRRASARWFVAGGAGVAIVAIGWMLLGGVDAGADRTLGQRSAMGAFGLLAGALVVAAIGLRDLLSEAVRHRILRRHGPGSEQSK